MSASCAQRWSPLFCSYLLGAGARQSGASEEKVQFSYELLWRNQAGSTCSKDQTLAGNSSRSRDSAVNDATEGSCVRRCRRRIKQEGKHAVVNNEECNAGFL
mmetsp:Transcript_911/g.1980  ORF Transcript_911/g.1980 Transcript_911/m.1980 type:complete len:102 (+) Transcript_911:71-376(+)